MTNIILKEKKNEYQFPESQEDLNCIPLILIKYKNIEPCVVTTTITTTSTLPVSLLCLEISCGQKINCQSAGD